MPRWYSSNRLAYEGDRQFRLLPFIPQMHWGHLPRARVRPDFRVESARILDNDFSLHPGISPHQRDALALELLDEDFYHPILPGGVEVDQGDAQRFVRCPMPPRLGNTLHFFVPAQIALRSPLTGKVCQRLDHHAERMLPDIHRGTLRA